MNLPGLSVKVSNLVIKHVLFPFPFGSADMVFGYAVSSIPNTYKLQGVTQKTHITSSFRSDLKEQMLIRDAILKLMKAKSRMKLQANSKCIDFTFNIGDAVLLRLQPYGQKSLANRPFQKLSLHFFALTKSFVMWVPLPMNLKIQLALKSSMFLY